MGCEEWNGIYVERCMKAVVMTAVGGPEVLAVREVEKPRAGAGELVVRVKAAGVNPIDYKVRKTGALGFGPGKVLGMDVAGEVAEVGPGAEEFKVGERVFYSAEFSMPGGYAEFHRVRAALVARMPGHLSFVEAAAVPLAGITAYDGVMGRGEVRLGQTVLIAAANGGVGSIAVQLAKAAGAYVFATCSSRSEEFVRSIPTVCGKGPDRVLNYQTEDWSAVAAKECAALHAAAGGVGEVGLDLVYDCAGQDVVSRCIPIMKPLGRIVTIVNPAGKLDEAYRKNVTIHYEFMRSTRATLGALAVLLERKQVVPLVDSVMKLEEAGEAHRKLEGGGVRGKIVLEVGS